jgi:hypothetical protein
MHCLAIAVSPTTLDYDDLGMNGRNAKIGQKENKYFVSIPLAGGCSVVILLYKFCYISYYYVVYKTVKYMHRIYEYIYYDG